MNAILRKSARSVLVAFAALAASCVTFSVQRVSQLTPPDDEVIDTLGTELTDLEQCLEVFGAPLWVWEGGAGSHIGATIVYGWYRSNDTGGSVSVPLVEGFSASMRFNRVDQDTRGLLLVFDDDWKLFSWRRGKLRDLSLPPERRRPLDIEE